MGIKMVKNKLFLGLFALIGIMSLIGLISAAAVINSVVVNGTSSSDYFFSNYSGNNIIQVVANISGMTSSGLVTANFSSFGGTINCGLGSAVVNMTNASYGGEIYNGTCDVGDEATVSNFSAISPIIVTAVNASHANPSIAVNTNTLAILYNMTTPLMPQGCQRFGPQTTNFTSVLDFARVNFVIHIQNNFTCMIPTGGPPGLYGDWKDVMILNLTSVNLSTPAQAALLGQLPQAINLSIARPKSFPGYSRIFVDSGFFAALNTNASIKLIGLPFTTKPNVTGDNPSELMGTSWASNGFDAGFDVVTGNLTINVTGFSGYNATDNIPPLINFNSPAAAANVSSGTVVLGAFVNGTGTEPSYISINNLSGGSAYIYNETSGANSAGCQNISSDGETRNCTIYFAVSSLQEGANTITVSVIDYGGTSGNSNSSTRTFNVDRIGPAVTVYSPTNYINTTSVLFNISAIDATTASASCWMTLNGGAANQTMTKSGNYFNYTNSSIALGNYLAAYYCNDTLGNINSSVTTNFTIEQTAPTLSSQSANPSTTSASISYTASEAVNVTINYGTTTSLGSSTASSGYSSSSSVSITGLTDNEKYYYNITICDQAGNCATNGTFDFTTDEETSGGGDGGGGDYTPAFWSMTYLPGEDELESGYSKQLLKKERVRINIDGDYHYVGIIDLSSTSVTINVSSTPQTAVLSIGETKKFEVTDDDYFDLSVELNSIDESKANLTIYYIYEKMTGEEIAESLAAKTGATINETGAGADGATEGGETASSPFYKRALFWIVFVLVLIAAGIGYYLKVLKPKMIQRSIKVSER